MTRCARERMPPRSQCRPKSPGFSVAVWLFWLVPYVCGMLMGMPAAHATTGGALAVSAAVSVR